MSTPSRREPSRSIFAAGCLAACCVPAAAHAQVIRFQNTPPGYSWMPEFIQNQGTTATPLDITQGVTQSPTANNRSLWQYTPGNVPSSGFIHDQWLACAGIFHPASQARVARSITPTNLYNEIGQPTGATLYGPACFQPGEVIGPAADWQSGVIHFHGSFTRGNQIAIGHSYFGIEVTMADGIHYGFIEVNGGLHAVLSWGYQSQPNTPLVIPGGCGSSDFNGDGDFGTDADIEAFFACLGGSCCSTCYPSGSDFNNDGDSGTDADIEAFFRVLGGSPCM